MQPDIKALWLEALKSGKYQYAHGTYRTTGGACFCAVGVLLDLIDPTIWREPTVDDPSTIRADVIVEELLDKTGLTYHEFCDILTCNDLEEARDYSMAIQHIERNL